MIYNGLQIEEQGNFNIIKANKQIYNISKYRTEDIETICNKLINNEKFNTEEHLYYYAGYDHVHRFSDIKNFYWGTKENIINYLKSQCEFIDGTTQEEKDEHIELMFNCYTGQLD